MTGARATRDGTQRADLVAAAARVLAREGVSDATTRRIAAEAGIPLGKIHYWFATKDDLMAEVVADHVRRIREAVAVAPRGAADGDEDAETAGILDLFRAAFAVDEQTERPAGLVAYELMTWALRTPGHEALAARQVAAFRDAARATSAPWHAEHGDAVGIDHDVLAQLLAALYDGLVLAWLADPEGTDPDAVFQLLSRMLTSLARGD